MTILTYVREAKDGRLKKYNKCTEEYWDPNDLTEYIDEAKLWNYFLVSLSFKEWKRLMNKFEKFKER